MVNFRAYVVSFLALFIIVSCSESNNIFDAPVQLQKPEMVLTLDGIVVNMGEDAPLGVSNIKVIDSVLLFMSKNLDERFKANAYSLNDFTALGHFLPKGRAHNELLSPLIKGKMTDGSVYIFDLNLCSSYSFDLAQSVASKTTVLEQVIELPPMTLDAYPLRDNHIVVIPEEFDYMCVMLDNDGNALQSWSLYPGFSGMEYFDRLSAGCAINVAEDKMVLTMCMLPQVNFLDLNTSERNTTAVSKEYKNWGKLLGNSPDDRRIYYSSITSSSDFVLSLFFGCPLMDWVQEKTIPHIHIFDWKGNWKYDISVKENLSSIAYDASSKTLYAVDKEDVVYKYDLSFL